MYLVLKHCLLVFLRPAEMYNLPSIRQIYLYKCTLIHTLEVITYPRNSCDLHIKVEFIHPFSDTLETSLLIMPLLFFYSNELPKC